MKVPPSVNLLSRIDTLLHSKSDRELRHALERQEPRDIADVIDSLRYGRRKTFTLLPPELQAEVLLLISERSRDSILPRLADYTIARLLHFINEDDATDILQQLPSKRQEHILSRLKEDRKKRIEKLLIFSPQTAGGLMDLNFIEVDPNQSIHRIILTLQDYAKHHKRVPVALLHTSEGTFWLPARALLSAPLDTEISRIGIAVPVIHHLKDRTDVLDLMRRENSDIACVMDDHHKILGVIHLNDLLQVTEEEASEYAYRMGAVGVMGQSYLKSRFSQIWKKRVGWLSVLFIAELFTFTALAEFESSITTVTALALFVPLVISTGGNSGSQAATLITRALALGQITPHDWWKVLKRELLMGLALGLTLGAIGFIRASLTPQHVLGNAERFMIGIVIAQSVAAICLWGTLVGSLLPLLFKKLGLDPGYASSPFVATFVDVTGIIIYFSIANIFILPSLL